MDQLVKRLEFTKEQKEAIEKLKIDNESTITKLNKILNTYKKQTQDSDEEAKIFWKLMASLEKSNSGYPLGHFTNYYYRGFQEPVGESFISEWGDKNPNFLPLTEKDRVAIESKLPDYPKKSKIISETIEKIGALINDSLAENIFIKRIVGLPEKYMELEKINGDWWYPSSISKNDFKIKGTFPTWDVHLTVTLPYHREKMMKYDVLFNTVSLLRSKIEKFLLILNSINAYLPFADLIPGEKMPHTIVSIETNSNNNSTSIGDSNSFEKEAVIGDGGKIGK